MFHFCLVCLVRWFCLLKVPLNFVLFHLFLGVHVVIISVHHSCMLCVIAWNAISLYLEIMIQLRGLHHRIYARVKSLVFGFLSVESLGLLHGLLDLHGSC